MDAREHAAWHTGRRLTAAREKLGLSSAEFANLVQKRHRVIVEHESGARPPKHDTLLFLASNLGCNPADLVCCVELAVESECKLCQSANSHSHHIDGR